MGIYDALTTAVTGLSAQSFALDQISGNIANSQTIAYKRTDTSFVDLISDTATNQPMPGGVASLAQSTNRVQGSITASSSATAMAINGDGFFIVEPATGFSDNKPVFSGVSDYTRRGDFTLDKSGYLVNGAGYYLKGLSIDPKTGNVSGSVPQAIQVSNSLMPAKQTTTITYQANLPSYPLTATAKPSTPGSELLGGTTYSAALTGSVASLSNGTAIPAADQGNVTINGQSIATGTTVGDFIANINAATATTGVSAALDGAGHLALGSTSASGIVLSGFTAGQTTDVGLSNGTTAATAASVYSAGHDPSSTTSGGTGQVVGSDVQTFLDHSIAGGAVTAYDATGNPISLQLRWAKTSSSASGGTDTWNLFYETNSNATGAQVAWQNANVDYTFNSSGQLTSPSSGSITLAPLSVDGVSIASVTLSHGSGGLTQYADANGTTKTTTLTQDGYGVGEPNGVTVTDQGRIRVSYSNGQAIDVAEVPLVGFNAPDALKKLDGGAFAETLDSGSPIASASGSIVGSSLEGSNTDIADEFTKLIVTQQAYSANTRVITTSQEMMKEALNMVVN